MKIFPASISCMALVALSTSVTAQSNTARSANPKPLELRMDVGSISIGDGTVGIAAGGPGQVAFAVYMNEKFAIEPAAEVTFVGGESRFSFGTLALGASLPYYFQSRFEGIFVAPGVTIENTFGDLGSGGDITIKADLGYKKPINDKWTVRTTANFGRAAGDFGGRFVVGANVGITYFIR